MHELHHEIDVNAPPHAVYEAITTQEGFSRWWTGDCQIQPQVGSVAELSLPDGTPVLKMRMDELKPQKRIVWYCLGDDAQWKDTRVLWDFSERDGRTVLHLLHAYWRSPGRAFAIANTTWGYLMHRLKAALEDHPSAPSGTGDSPP